MGYVIIRNHPTDSDVILKQYVFGALALQQKITDRENFRQAEESDFKKNRRSL